ncbi:MAG TPA: hypothetical protein VL463_03740 [Kofleriaceae bacterium]|nr:hypothetical protein [Kofleriaceae bacterium]
MSMLNTFSRRMTVLTALAGASALAACGDDATKGGPADAKIPVIDAPNNTPDGSPDAMPPDAMPTAEVAGTVAVTDVTVLDSDSAAAGGIKGGAISITFSDLTMNGGTVLSGTSQVNGCVVVKYDPTHLPNPPEDAGAITVTNNPANESPATGLLKTVGPCVFNAAAKTYLCVSNNDTAQTATAVGSNATIPGSVTYQFTTTPFTGEKLVGSYLRINGFTNAHFNSGASAFPIVAQPTDNTVLVINPAGAGDVAEPGTTGLTDTVLNGFNPVPALGGNGPDFLGTGGITITKTTATAFKMFAQNIDVPGQGWTLSDPGDPTAIPLTGTATEQKYGCGTGNTCGDGSTTLIQAMIISGRATKKSVAGLPNYGMPTEVPGTDTWLEYQCGFIGSKTATLDAAALQAIIDFAPTRVEMRVINSAGNIITDTSLPGSPQTFVVAGHAFVGHTTAP